MESSNKKTTAKDIETMREELLRAKANASEKAKNNKKNINNKIYKILSNTIFVILITVLIITFVNIQRAKANGEIPSVLGYQIYKVETGSMIPTLNIGDMFISKKLKDTTVLEVGDIVTYKHGADVITHRIIEIVKVDNGIAYRTKGDNPNNSPDLDLLEPENIIAVFVRKLL